MKFGVFFFFAGIGVLAVVFAVLLVPETKNVPIEEVEETVVHRHWCVACCCVFLLLGSARERHRGCWVGPAPARGRSKQGEPVPGTSLLHTAPCAHTDTPLPGASTHLRFWKRAVKGTVPPTDLRSGSSLVQMSRGPSGAPSLSFVQASAAGKVPGASAGNMMGAPHGMRQ
jgi:hypothetical protein